MDINNGDHRFLQKDEVLKRLVGRSAFGRTVRESICNVVREDIEAEKARCKYCCKKRVYLN